jgi:hypothetical protein
MGEKGMETPAPTRSGVAGAAETLGRATGVSDMAAAAGSSSIGNVRQGGVAGLGQALTGNPGEQTSGAIGQPPKG